MKNKLLWLVVIIVISLPAIIWWMQPSKSMPVIIMDKTVPDLEYREHKGLTWFINHEKYSEGPRSVKDYIGFYPSTLKYSELKSIKEQVLESPLLHLADVYGVYTEDLKLGRASLERSGLVYGGLTKEDFAVISAFTSLKGKTLLAEFNTFASPTSLEVRNAMEKTLGVQWTGWIGRYFVDLSNDEIPDWMYELYEEQYGEKWDFTSAGIVYVHENSTLVVLEQDIHIGEDQLQVRRSEHSDAFLSAREEQKFYYWFDIITTNDVETLYTFETDVTEDGAKMLEKFGIPKSFPAVTLLEGDYTAYYFAGDFVDIIAPLPPYWIVAMKSLMGISSVIENQEQFFWKVYIPMLTEIYEDVYESYKQ